MLLLEVTIFTTLFAITGFSSCRMIKKGESVSFIETFTSKFKDVYWKLRIHKVL